MPFTKTHNTPNHGSVDAIGAIRRREIEIAIPSHPSSKMSDGHDRDHSASNEKSARNATSNKKDWKGVAAGVFYTLLPKWFDAALIGFLIFGGCCGNVFALEAIIKDEPAAGPLITFVQFVVVSLFTLPSFLSWSAGPGAFFIKSPVIPLRSWTIYTVFFLTVNLLNNWAFAYRISVPLHIILRSGGPVASMLIGYLYNGRRYSRIQILSVFLLTLGVVGAALADAQAQGKSINIQSPTTSDSKSTLTFVIGFTILALAMLLAAFQGVYADRLYAVHGNTHWREALLYSHMLSLPFFLPTYPQLSSQFRACMESSSILSTLSTIPAVAESDLFANLTTTATLSNSIATSTATATATAMAVGSNSNMASQARQSISILWPLFKDPSYALLRSVLAATPSKIFYLALNALTQYFCIRGVYLLAAKSSSLTVTIVLNIRKLVSLLLSIYLFGNHLSTGVLVGAGFVFLGGALYGFASARAKNNRVIAPEYLQKKSTATNTTVNGSNGSSTQQKKVKV